MDSNEFEGWFEANKRLLETAYLAGEHPWQQSGFGLHSNRTGEQWEAQRRPIAYCLGRSGTFLDIGCANGYLLESVMRWAAESGISVVPYGLDFSERLVALARERLPLYAPHMFVGNAWDWIPPLTFDYVRTELVYVPDSAHRVFVTRLLDQFLQPDGRLLVAEYRGRADMRDSVQIDRYLVELGFKVASIRVGCWDGMERTRVAVLTRSQESEGRRQKAEGRRQKAVGPNLTSHVKED